MKADAMGFKYPVVDFDKCVECGLCEKVCSFKPDYSTPENFETPIPYGVRQKDDIELMKSRSGGAFAAFSDWVLDKGGVVYGAGYKGHFEVAHCRATTRDERDAMRGSKYVQSNLDGVFHQVRKDLLDGKWVLFSGTPCQTSGLKSFIPVKLQERLLVVDIVCHGTPSPSFWGDNISDIEKKAGHNVVGVDFRNKRKFGWRDHKETYTLDNGEEIDTDRYTYIFYREIMSRDSCEKCHFTNLRRPSDLTLADFWGWEKTDEGFNSDNRGASLILVNTGKGKMVFDDVSDKFDIIRPTIANSMQGHLEHPSVMNPERFEFRDYYRRHGFEATLKKYGNVSLRFRVNSFIRRVLRKIRKIAHI